MGRYREQGVVLRTYKLGETDRIVHVLTQGRGKLRAVAKGVRRPGSRFGGRLEPYGHVDLQLWEGRSLDVIEHAELITSHEAVRADVDLSACGAVLVEAADRVAQEGQRSVRLFLLLLDGLRRLADAPRRPGDVVDAYLLRLAAAAGFEAQLDGCAGCGTPDAHPVFSIAAGGALCAVCAPPGSSPLEAAVLQRLQDWSVGELGRPGLDRRVDRTATALVSSYVTYHLGSGLRALAMVPR